ALVRPFDVVAEGEEGIGTQGHAGHLIQPFPLLFSGKYGRLLRKDLLPGSVSEHILVLFPDVDVNGVVSLSSLDILSKRQGEHLRALTEEPVVRFLPCQAGAVYSGLLTGAHTDRLSVLYIAYGIGLSVLQDDQGDLHIS